MVPLPKPGLPVLLASALLAACAGAPATPEIPPPGLAELLRKQGVRQGEPVASIPGLSLSGWRFVDDLHIIVDNGPGRDYLLTFSFPCRDLAWMDRIGYTTTAGIFGRLDRIVGRHLGTPVHCPVAEIHRLFPAGSSPESLP